MKRLNELTQVGRGRRLRPVARALLKEYGMASPRLTQLTEASNIIYKVSDPKLGEFVLRVTAPKSCHGPEETRSEVAWLHALVEETEIGCPAPVARLDGDFVSEFDVPGERLSLCSSLFRWVPGRMLDDVLTPANVMRQGTLMARLHSHAATFAPPEAFRIRTYDSVFPYAAEGFAGLEPLVLFNDGADAPLTPKQRTTYLAAHTLIAREFEKLLQSGESLRVIHNDLHVWNVKVDRDRLYALDFEDMMWGYPVQDIATTLYYYRWREDFETLLAAFRGGYEDVADWPESRAGQIETLIMGRALLLANFIAVSEDSEDISFAPEYLQRVEKRLRTYLDTEG